MISAFGVNHGGEISKGLPSHLKAITPNIAVQTKQFSGGAPLSRSDHSYLRVKAHLSGKQASAAHSKWNKMPKDLSDGNIARAEEARKPVVEAATKGKIARELSRRAVTDNTPIKGYKPKPRVPKQR